MAAARKKSQRRSATNRGAPPEPLTFFIDECLGGRALAEALRAAGHAVVLHRENFPQGTDDVAWLTALRERRYEWIVLTKDKQIRRRPLEIDALMRAGLRVFALTAGDLGTEAQVDAFLRGLRSIARISRQAGPYIARVTANGDVKVVQVPKPRQRKERMRRRSLSS